MSAEWLKGFIEERVRYLDPRSIVYFRCDPEYPVGRKIILSGQLLRGLLPSGMIVKTGRSCFNR